MIQPENIRQRHLTWDGMDLMFQGRVVCSLVPCEKYEKHWHLKFYWRDEPTPEFFNIYNARENARLYCIQKLSERPLEAPLSDLNEVGGTHAA